MTSEWRSRLRWRDLFATSAIGLVGRRGRTALTAAGIAVGVAAMVAVTGISASSRAALLAELDAFGTNVLEVRAVANGLRPEPLPVQAGVMLDRVATVTDSAAVVDLDVGVRRSGFDTDMIGIEAIAVDADLGPTLRATAASGRLLDDGTRSLPVAVLGAAAADRLGIAGLTGGPLVAVGGHDFVIIGILEPLPLNPDIDRAVLVGDLAAIERFELVGHPSRVFLRLVPDRVDDTFPVLAATANPGAPSQVAISRPSDLVEARAQIDRNLRNLLLGLGAVALLVGGVGIANIMVIAVLERTGEIGLRRALGAHQVHVAGQFVVEAVLVSALGGAGGVLGGSLITAVYARRQGWLLDVPVWVIGGGLLAAVAIGAASGLYPAIKAARLDPARAAQGDR